MVARNQMGFEFFKHGRKPTISGKQKQPHPVGAGWHYAFMASETAKLLARNVAKLIEHRYGELNQSQFIRDSRIANGTCTRVLRGETSVGLDKIEAIAQFFKVPTWVLITPNLEPGDLPELIKHNDRVAADIAQEALNRIAARSR